MVQVASLPPTKSLGCRGCKLQAWLSMKKE